MDNQIKRLLKRLLVIILLVAFSILLGMFFAFGGNNPLLIHISNFIDLTLVAVTVLFVMALVYKLYAFFTGKQSTIVSSNKKRQKPLKQHDNSLPELNELIDNLDTSD